MLPARSHPPSRISRILAFVYLACCVVGSAAADRRRSTTCDDTGPDDPARRRRGARPLRRRRPQVIGCTSRAGEQLRSKSSTSPQNRRLMSRRAQKAHRASAYIPDSHNVAVASGEDGTVPLLRRRPLKLARRHQRPRRRRQRPLDPPARKPTSATATARIAVIDPSKCKENRRHTSSKPTPNHSRSKRNGKRIFVNVPRRRSNRRHRPRKDGTSSPDGRSRRAGQFPNGAGQGATSACSSAAASRPRSSSSTPTPAKPSPQSNASATPTTSSTTPTQAIYISGGAGSPSSNRRTRTITACSETSRRPRARARTSAFVPQTGTLYVAVPHRGSQRAGTAGVPGDATAIGYRCGDCTAANPAFYRPAARGYTTPRDNWTEPAGAP